MYTPVRRTLLERCGKYIVEKRRVETDGTACVRE
jgi:hypothetical protein